MKVKASANRPARTLSDLATTTGVSVATVSNAFNRPDQLSAKLRERILAAAKEAGYAGPDPTARALSRGERGAFGLVLTEQLSYAFSDPAAVLILEGLARACEEAETGLLLVPLAAKDGSAARTINAAAVDGLALYSLPDDDPAVAAVLARSVTAVMIDQPFIPGVPFVSHDHRAAGRIALTHLLDLGHRDIGVLGYRLTPERNRGPLLREQQLRAGYQSTRARLKGYADALRAFGLDSQSLTFFESSSNEPLGGAASASEMLGADPSLTAILTDSDRLALGVLQAAATLGLRVPEDLSIIGMDDIPAAAFATTPLTTVRQPLVEKGVTAGRILLGQRSGRRKIVFPVELVVRATTAGPGSRRR
jgi:DNA-binding LacI/PurR family transcriptional regulator